MRRLLFVYLIILLFSPPLLNGRKNFVHGWGKKILPEEENDLRDSMSERTPKTEDSFSDSLSNLQNKTKRSSCSCYEIKNEYCCSQPLCICSNICFNGNQLIGLTGVPCENPVEAVPGGPLNPISCENERLYKSSLEKLVLENKISPIGHVSNSWISTRAKVTWRKGSTFLLFLDQSTTNLAHFVAKAHQLLLANNATVNAMRGRIDRIILHRHVAPRQRMRKYGTGGFHASLLRTALIMALEPLYGPLVQKTKEMAQDLLLGDLPMAYGRVEFEAAFRDASEENPICLEKVVLPGHLKGISYVGGVFAAQPFIETLKKVLAIEPEKEDSGKVKILWIQRDPSKSHGRRAIIPKSVDGLRNILNKLNGEVREMDFDGIPFKEQIEAVQNADIILSLHGAGLTNAATFGKRGAVIIEIMPYKVYLEMFGIMAVNTGLSYMMHQCSRGETQTKDEIFDETSIVECNRLVGKCLEYYLQHRNVELTDIDLKELEEMLRIAMVLVEDGRVEENQKKRWLEEEKGKLCLSYKKGSGCRENILRSPSMNPTSVCVLRSDCLEKKAFL